MSPKLARQVEVTIHTHSVGERRNAKLVGRESRERGDQCVRTAHFAMALERERAREIVVQREVLYIETYVSATRVSVYVYTSALTPCARSHSHTVFFPVHTSQRGQSGRERERESEMRV